MLNQVYKTYSFRGTGGVNRKNPLILYTFNILAHFVIILQIIHLKNVDMYTFCGGGGRGLRKCMFCTLIEMLTIMYSP